jgi:hypothetical protein
MSRIAEVLSTERDADGVLTVRVDPGGGAVKSAEAFADAGSDCVPLPGDYVAISESAGAGTEQVTGYHDPTNPGVAEGGEVRRYARNADREIVGYLWLKRDGSYELESLTGAPLRLKTTGPIILDSPDIRLGDAAGAQLARVGDICAGTLHAAGTAPGTPIVPSAPIPGGGVPFACQIVSGSSVAKAK